MILLRKLCKRGEPALAAQPGRRDAAEQLWRPASISGHVFCLKDLHPFCGRETEGKQG